MSRWRWMAALGVVAVLAAVVVAVGVWGQEAPTTTTQAAVVSTSSSLTSTSSSTSTTTTTSVVVDREAEVEAVLQELWFGWFDAIYRKDEEALRRVVATEDAYQDGLTAMERATFIAAPTLHETRVEVLEILRDSPTCLVVWSRVDVSVYRGEGMTSEAVEVLWPTSDGWAHASSWLYPEDLWEQDCPSEEGE